VWETFTRWTEGDFYLGEDIIGGGYAEGLTWRLQNLFDTLSYPPKDKWIYGEFPWFCYKFFLHSLYCSHILSLARFCIFALKFLSIVLWMII
jgi:hypothetical protein